MEGRGSQPLGLANFSMVEKVAHIKQARTHARGQRTNLIVWTYEIGDQYREETTCSPRTHPVEGVLKHHRAGRAGAKMTPSNMWRTPSIAFPGTRLVVGYPKGGSLKSLFTSSIPL